VPGQSTWRPIAVALGVVGFYCLAIVSLSFYAKPLIGQAAWRAIHHLSFGLYVATLAHGLMAGTDTSHPAVVALYAATGAATLVLLAIRIIQSRQAPSPAAGRAARAERPARPVAHDAYQTNPAPRSNPLPPRVEA